MNKKKQEIKMVMSYMFGKYPALRQHKPLHLNAHIQLAELESGYLTHNQMQLFFSVLTRRYLYQKVLIASTHRIDFLGNIKEEITDKDRDRAMLMKEKIKEKHRRKKEKAVLHKEYERKRLANIKKREKALKKEEEKARKEARKVKKQAKRAERKKLLCFSDRNQVETKVIKKRTLNEN